MSGYGFHWSKCPGGGEGGGILVLAVLAVVIEKVLHVIVQVMLVTGACAALAFMIVFLIARDTRRREAAYAASPQHQRLIGATATPPVTRVTPQVTQGTTPPVIVNHYGPQFHIYGEDGREAAARLIRPMIPGMAGDAITEEE